MKFQNGGVCQSLQCLDLKECNGSQEIANLAEIIFCGLTFLKPCVNSRTLDRKKQFIVLLLDTKIYAKWYGGVLHPHRAGVSKLCGPWDRSGLLLFTNTFCWSTDMPMHLHSMCLLPHKQNMKERRPRHCRLHRDEGNLLSALQRSGYLCPIKEIDNK